MELLYCWIDKFRNYKNTQIRFSNKFIINYHKNDKKIEIKKNFDYVSIYPKHISNINVIVGKNGVGKTNLLDLIGLRISDRQKHNDEFEIIYKNPESLFHTINDIEKELKNSIYFFIYYIGKNKAGKELFCFEGNDIDSFIEIIELNYNEKNELNYWREKYWFAFVCSYDNGKLIYEYTFNYKTGNYTIKKYDDYRDEQYESVIITMRDKLNYKYYDSISVKDKDESKICVPRRVCELKTKFLQRKIEMIYKQFERKNRQMFRDDSYELIIRYNNLYGKYYFTDEKELILDSSYNNLKENEKDICRVLETYIYYFYSTILEIISKEELYKESNIIQEVKKIYLERNDFNGFMNYYLKFVETIAKNYFDDDKEIKHIINGFINLEEVLLNNDLIKFSKNCMTITLNTKNNINEINNIIKIIIDEKEVSNRNEITSAFGNFFSYSIENMSDGETAYLSFFSSLYEQISVLTPNKERYIILLDEPEARMHPELTRVFVNELITFLEELSMETKRFQIIISTHSPFILSDIDSNNILYLEKDNNGICEIKNKDIETFGANIHLLLMDSFFMKSTIGEYSNKKIKEVIEYINYKMDSSTEEEKRYYLYIINSIGEPLIKNKLSKMFNEKIEKNNNLIEKLSEEINEKENLINKLKEKIKLLESEKENSDKNKY